MRTSEEIARVREICQHNVLISKKDGNGADVRYFNMAAVLLDWVENKPAGDGFQSMIEGCNAYDAKRVARGRRHKERERESA